MGGGEEDGDLSGGTKAGNKTLEATAPPKLLLHPTPYIHATAPAALRQCIMASASFSSFSSSACGSGARVQRVYVCCSFLTPSILPGPPSLSHPSGLA